MKRFLLFFLPLFLFLGCKTDSLEPALDLSIPFDPEIRKGTLPNGLDFYIRENQRPENRIVIRLVVKAGSLLEEEDQLGVAHLVEHLAFNGTSNFEKKAIVDYLESVGMRLGPSVNAYTSFEETVYMLFIPADDPEVVSTAWKIIRDWISELSFDPEEVALEKGVVQEEWRGMQGASFRSQNTLFPLLLGDSQYARRRPIGDMGVMSSAPLERIRDYYDQWYHPQLMSLIVVGDVDSQEVEKELFDVFQNPWEEIAPELPSFPISSDHEPKVGFFTDQELTQSMVELYVKTPAPSQETYGDYRESIVENLFSQAMNTRLRDLVRDPDGPLMQGGTGRSHSFLDTELTILRGVAKPGLALETFQLLLREMELVRRYGFTPQELEVAKTNLQRRITSLWEERNRQDSGDLASELVRHVTKGEPVPGLNKEYQLYLRFLPQITLEELGALGRNWLKSKGRVVMISAPQELSSTLPKEEEILQVMTEVESLELDNPYEDQITGALLETEPKAGEGTKVDNSLWEKLDFQEYVLENGARFYLRSTDFQEDQILLYGSSPGGLSVLEDEQFISGALASGYAMESGVGNWSTSDLERILAGADASLSTFITDTTQGFQGSSSRKDLETLFQLLHLRFTAPRFEERAYRALVSRYETIVASANNDPGRYFSGEFQRFIFQDHFRQRPWDLDRLSQWDPTVSEKLYRQFFSSPSDFFFVMVGNLEEEKTLELMKKYVASIPPGPQGLKIQDRGVDYPQEGGLLEIYRGQEPKVNVQMFFPQVYEEEPLGPELLNAMAEILSDRLSEVIREELGGTYSIRAYSTVSQEPRPRSLLHIYFSCEPGREDELIQGVYDQILWLQEGQGEDSYFQKERETVRRNHEVAQKNNSHWVSLVSGLLERGETPEDQRSIQELLERINQDEISRLAKKYIQKNRALVGILRQE